MFVGTANFNMNVYTAIRRDGTGSTGRWFCRLYGLWLPYGLYRDSHLQHHRTDSLTDPAHDPESFYWAAEDWRRLPMWHKRLVTAMQTLAGRLLLGPPYVAIRFLVGELARIGRGDFAHAGPWLLHLLTMTGLLYWVMGVCNIPFWHYVGLFAYPGLALALLRSFNEHRPAPRQADRTAIVEGNGPFAWLFLYNSLHVLHHQRPDLAWYRLPGVYAENRARFAPTAR